MRWAAPVAAALLAVVVLVPGRAADPEPPPMRPVGEVPAVDAPGLPDTVIRNPELYARLAVQHQSTVDLRYGPDEYTAADLPYVRYFSFYATPEKFLADDVLLFCVWLQQLSFEGAVRLPREVPGSKGRLFWCDIRWYGWNWAAFQAVAEREPWHQEPWIDHEHAEQMRRLIGVPVSDAARKKGVFHAQGIVRADWFVRETMESGRSPSYYDLLFARFRFKIERQKTGGRVKKIWPGGPDKSGKVYPRGFEYEADEYADKVVFKDFPADVAEWDQAFGLDKIRDFAKGARIDTDFGSIVEGGEDNPAKGSIVALHNRILQIQQGPVGMAMRSYDVFETAGLRDFSETLIFKGKNGFIKGVGVEAVFDAGELIYYLPNGGIAGFLIDGQGKRAEVAAGAAANLKDPPRLAPGVRNVRDCFTCHAPSGGFITPGNVLREFEAKGGKVKFKDQEKENRFRQFFFDWEERMEGVVRSFNRLVERCTTSAEKPWTGAILAQKIVAFIERYDAPVTPAVAAAEIGVPLEVFKVVTTEHGRVRQHVQLVAENAGEGHWPEAAKKVGVRFEVFKYIAGLSPRARLNQLAVGMAVPRRTFDVDVYVQLQMIRSYLVEVEKKAVYEPKGP